MISSQEYQQRRAKLMQEMSDNSIAIICTKPEYPRTQDSHFRFRPDSNFYYLTGFSEPEAIAVLIPNRAEGEYILFNRERDPAKEIWNGKRAGQAGGVQDYLADQAFPIEDFDLMLEELLANKETLYYQFGYENGIDEDIAAVRNEVRGKIRAGATFPNTIVNVSSSLHEMRIIKSPGEIEVLRKAANINVEAHIRGMKNCIPGTTERQLYSEIAYVYNQHGCMDVAYDPIVANGKNACVLHYFAGQDVLQDGELVLVDMGEEYEWYASDITRTYPVNGKFSPEQKAVYEAVLHVQTTMCDLVKPGADINELKQKSFQLITEQLVNLGILTGNVEQLVKDKAYADFYPHGLGHWMGLDVHDVSNYKVHGQWRKLAPGMVMTIEPGIYIQPDNENVDAKWRGIGVRIEDDVVVTQKGCDNLTERLAKTVEDIEALMAS
jgi:Xaa-Pro aminopeptidase